MPWVWFVNVWLFWPSFRAGSDALMAQCKISRHKPKFDQISHQLVTMLVLACADTRWSAAGFLVTSLVFLPWMLGFMIGEDNNILSPTLHHCPVNVIAINVHCIPRRKCKLRSTWQELVKCASCSSPLVPSLTLQKLSQAVCTKSCWILQCTSFVSVLIQVAQSSEAIGVLSQARPGVPNAADW